MARLIRADGSESELKPARGSKWTLNELQKAVGGFIELMPGIPKAVLMDEDGQSKRLPYNAKATGQVLALLRATGKPLRYIPQLVGDVLILADGERM